MTALRKLILGETRILPAGIALLVGVAVTLGEVAGAWWEDAGGFLLLALVIALLARSLAQVCSPYQRERPDSNRRPPA